MFKLSNYDYNYNYFHICNWSQVEITNSWKWKYCGNCLIEYRFIEQTAYSSRFGWAKKPSFLFLLINSSLIRAGTPLIRAVRHVVARGGRSHFIRLQLRSCSKIFESVSAIFHIWESNSYSDSGYNDQSNFNLPMFLLKMAPQTNTIAKI